MNTPTRPAVPTIFNDPIADVRLDFGPAVFTVWLPPLAVRVYSDHGQTIGVQAEAFEPDGWTACIAEYDADYADDVRIDPIEVTS